MKNQLNQINLNNKRIPTESIYDVILTLIVAFTVIWLIFSLTPHSHCCVYLIETK